MSASVLSNRKLSRLPSPSPPPSPPPPPLPPPHPPLPLLPSAHPATRYSARDYLMLLLLFLLAAYLRFRFIGSPPAIAFDELHFGKFISFYINRQYFFDVHPPLAKLILALHAYLIGYDGSYPFNTIGDVYLNQNVPYVALRSLPALIGSITCALVYALMKESGYPPIVATFSAALLAFDNAHIVHTRLILLDAPLILFMTCTFFAYVRFYKLRYHPFSRPWWIWLSLTGVALSFTISCKLIGLFTFLTIGSLVLLDLWDLLDIRRGHSLGHLGRHFLARSVGLILLPAIIYMFWFWIHFKILIYSGTGDDFMSAAFQQTLIGSPLTVSSEEIRYHDKILIRHRATKCYLHSHPQRYPLKYSDGRVSSQGQQVTCFAENDANNHWVIEPLDSRLEPGRAQVVRHNHLIRLRHLSTGSFLYTHDVASPSMATNQEFTTWPPVTNKDPKFNDTLFKLVIEDAYNGKPWKTKSGHFQLHHRTTGVAMWTKTTPLLPEWGFGQQEVNGHRKFQDSTLLWYADEVIRDNLTKYVNRPPPTAAKQVQKRSFLKKFFELQFAMLHYNSGLTEAHPYSTSPLNWPFLISGVSFWTGSPDDRKQVYMIGNLAGWWICVMCMSVMAGVMGADQFANRRGVYPIPLPVRNRLYRSGGFFILAWWLHYGPFFLMGRQLFLHHYLPAHLCSVMAAGMVLNFMITENVNHPISVLGPAQLHHKRHRMMYADVSPAAKYVVGAALAVVAINYAFTAPLTYGTPALTPEQVRSRRMLSTWTLHFAK